MFSSVAFDVVLGLLFIYLLYSLLATVLSEITATFLGLRARNLREAIDRMLNDEKESGLLSRIWDSLKLMKNPKNKIVNGFYDQPEIKYLGSSGIFKAPSYFKAGSFSKSLMCFLFGNIQPDSHQVGARLKEIVDAANTGAKEFKKDKLLDAETAKYIYNLWLEAKDDVDAFKRQLEGWFDRTMDQATEWYKRKIQIVLLILGFFMAWIFCADTFVIIRNLSVDKDAREQLVSMANAYIESHPALINGAGAADSIEFAYSRQKLDSLLVIKKQIEADINKSNNLIGIGGWLPDTVAVSIDKKSGARSHVPQVDSKSLSSGDKKITEGKLGFSFWEKITYLLRLAYHHFFGFLVTAIAISLGAPFWFDLLNKLVKIRTSKKELTAGEGQPAQTPSGK
jgi:hypothetical protein